MTQTAPSHSIVAWPFVVWLNIQVYSLTLLLTAVFVLIALPYIGLHRIITRNDRRNRWLIRRTISRYGSCIIRTGWPGIRVRYVDLEPAAIPPFVLTANHPSSSDGFLMAFLPLEAVQVLNIWPAHLPLIGFMARIAEYLKPRETPWEEFLAAGTRLISQGVSIVAFPEGTRTGFKELGQFHGSAFRLAMANHTPVVPIAISGNEAIPPRGSWWVHPGKITVTKLPAVTPTQYEGMTPFKLKSIVRESIRAHLEQRMADEFPATVEGLIPHGPSMRMVDHLMAVGDAESQATYTVAAGSPFVDDTGRLDELAFIEMIAQTFGAVHGYHLSPEERAAHRGLLIGVKDMAVTGDARVGETLKITVRRVAKFGDFGVIDGEVHNPRGELLAKAEIKVWRPEDAAKADL